MDRSHVSIGCPTEGCRELLVVELADPDDRSFRLKPNQKLKPHNPGCRGVFKVTRGGKIRTIEPGKPSKVTPKLPRPAFGSPSLAVFAQLETEKQILEYANNFGLLDVTRDDLLAEERAPLLHTTRLRITRQREKIVTESLNTWRTAIVEVRRVAAAIGPARKAKGPGRRLDLVGRINQHLRAGVTYELLPTRDRKVVLRVIAHTLRAFLWSQVASELCDPSPAAQPSVRQCAFPGCDKLAGIGRRTDARFCSTNHRVRFAQLSEKRAIQLHQAHPRLPLGEIVGRLRAEGWQPRNEKSALGQVKIWIHGAQQEATKSRVS